MRRLIKILKWLSDLRPLGVTDSSYNEKPLRNIDAAKRFIEFSFKRAQQEYADNSDTWKLLDAKAQSTATIAGIFIAATFAFVRNSNINLSGMEIALFCFGVISLCVSVWFAVKAMVIREVIVPPTGKQALLESKQILESISSASECEERYVRMLFDTTSNWVYSSDDMLAKVNEKGVAVARAQWGLLFSIIFFAALICVTVINLKVVK